MLRDHPIREVLLDLDIHTLGSDPRHESFELFANMLSHQLEHKERTEFTLCVRRVDFGVRAVVPDLFECLFIRTQRIIAELFPKRNLRVVVFREVLAVVCAFEVREERAVEREVWVATDR